MKKDKSEFLKYAYKSGKIKNLEEAFNDFPVEDEWHKGKIENVINEKIEEYGANYEIGDIVFVSIYTYSDGSKGNNHFFVIVDQDNNAVPIENFAMIISSNLKKLKYSSNKLLLKDNINNLLKDSLVKTDVLYKILNSQILFKIGKVDKDKIEEYKRFHFEDN